MPPLAIAQLIFGFLSSLPQDAAIVQAALNDHWGKDHAAQAQKALGYLGAIVTSVAGGIESGTSSAIPSAQMGSPPPAA